ncbi:hypothetical protein ASPWEDRAFT_49222 [Aspergillus wentii DTO 134E9]|uniref:DUF7820 domain-containing protein n=1 Tax=Aspergillus wentii DTO 134E9 TaxID=1073089 RepID=A0A1L9RW74_ASPWE|nr:uncharacterized protein ASPWEDRAFT_49222 [Aspergillus wentii DTO 134E9]KAI9929128.1 hypothetical protein MW887_001532 [Aspergillus wentii]OJJ39175.1 hypothetical protein ASPWEDRAFT_49222 [Aspergillus wentii DTO 134E9]
MSGRLSPDHSRSLSRSSQSQRLSQGQDPDAMPQNSSSGHSNNPNVFSDEYSLEPIDSEQATLTPRSPSISSVASSSTLRSTAVPSKPYSTTNDPEPSENPFGDEARVSFDDTPYRSSLPQKGVEASNRNSIASTTPSMTQRSQSISSRFSMPPRALSPYTGATGPSHPYAMYPQVGVSRSPSITTTSTVRPIDRPLGDTNAPQHPYAMYTQNVVPEEDLDTAAIPLGFPGHNQAYQRPPGRADDDVGDLIGPDGHTEQLPPYSRYPDGAAPKPPGTFETLNAAAIPQEADHHTNHVGPPVSEVSSRTLVSEPPISRDGNQIGNNIGNNSGGGGGGGGGQGGQGGQPEEAPATGVMAFEEKLKTKGKKKACCGLPIWTLVLVGVVMIVVACIGGVIGGVLGAKKATSEESKKSKGPPIVTVTATPRMDATPVSTTPAYLKTLPTGSYVIPANPKNQSKFCIADHDYNTAWSCATKGKELPISIGGSDLGRTITFEPDTSSFSYGAQPPYLPHKNQSLSMMYDTQDLSLGPALFFFAQFDKLVVVHQDKFPSNALSKRYVSEEDLIASAMQMKQTTQVGDQPWFCWWNSTAMEFFLYINETTKEYQYSATASTTTTTGFLSSETGSSSLANYPRRIKISENRNYPGAKSPYCQQMKVLDNGDIATVSPHTVDIAEIEPTPTTTIKANGVATQTYTATAQYESTCYCASLTD